MINLIKNNSNNSNNSNNFNNSTIYNEHYLLLRINIQV